MPRMSFLARAVFCSVVSLSFWFVKFVSGVDRVLRKIQSFNYGLIFRFSRFEESGVGYEYQTCC